MSRPLLDFVDALEETGDAEDVVALLSGLWRRAGFGLTFIARVRKPRESSVSVGEILGDWPLSEKRRYMSLRCWEFDPLVRHCLASDGLVCLHHMDFAQRVTHPTHRKVMERDFSWRWPARAVVPVQSRDGCAWMVAAAGEQTPDVLAGTVSEWSANLRLAAYAAEARIVRLARGDRDGAHNPLSPRETECLLWLASGLRNDRIAERMGISGSTVEMHLANARRKLNARTREQAVARAVALRLIEP